MIFFVFFLFFAVPALITYIISKVIKNKFVKYTPVFLALILIIYNIVMLITISNPEGFRDLAYFLSILLFACSLLGSLMAGLIIDYKLKNNYLNKKL